METLEGNNNILGNEGSERYLKAIIRLMRSDLLDRHIVPVDEVLSLILKLNGKKRQTISYMLLYCTNNDRKDHVLLYDYQILCSGDNDVVFL